MEERFSIQVKQNNEEELPPEYTSDFPYTASRARLSWYSVPWHWHKAVEIFYIESGSILYETPNGQFEFSTDMGGFMNSGVLHTSSVTANRDTVQLLHIFDASLVSGTPGSRIEQKYVAPLLSAPGLEMLSFSPNDPQGAEILDLIRKSFTLSPEEPGYEIALRNALSEIWLKLWALPRPEVGRGRLSDEKIKQCLAFVHANFGHSVKVGDIAASAFISERECYRLFARFLHTTPLEYLREYRLRKARELLCESDGNITDIALACGFSSGSAFSKLFREQNGMTPLAFRRYWQNFNK